MFVPSKLLLFIALICLVHSETEEEATVPPPEYDDDDSSTELVPQDLYVIKTIVYEVGILTDASNDTGDFNETHDQVDVSFYNPSQNGSGIDLSNIPLPVQTNVSGVSVTGLIPSGDLATILLPPGEVPAPALPKKQVTVTQNISTTNPEKGSEIISNLPKILGLTKFNSSELAKGTTTEKAEEE